MKPKLANVGQGLINAVTKLAQLGHRANIGASIAQDFVNAEPKVGTKRTKLGQSWLNLVTSGQISVRWTSSAMRTMWEGTRTKYLNLNHDALAEGWRVKYCRETSFGKLTKVADTVSANLVNLPKEVRYQADLLGNSWAA